MGPRQGMRGMFIDEPPHRPTVFDLSRNTIPEIEKNTTNEAEMIILQPPSLVVLFSDPKAEPANVQ